MRIVRNAVLGTAVFGLLCITGLTGCETLPWQTGNDMPPVELLDDEPAEAPLGDPVISPEEQGLGLSTEQRFKDVPLPAGAREDLDRTYVYESSTLQIGRMVYTSKAGVTELAQFYIQECPTADWKLVNVMQAEGARLFFKKPGKRLEVTVTPQGIGRPRILILHLTPDEEGGMLK